jgi:ubiquinone/menaquinone biosynthesis C-methylase UbiE
MTISEALNELMKDPQQKQNLALGYLTGTPQEDADLFYSSAEFKETLRWLGPSVESRIVADLGAGRGIASFAFAKAGAERVYAIEPDPDIQLGGGAIRQLGCQDRIEIVASYGEKLDLESTSIDIVYCRQVLHHAQDLGEFMHECHRVLKPGGLLMACREHCAETPEELASFLASHPVHVLAGGEHAFALEEYLGAIRGAGFLIKKVLQPFDSVICAYPSVFSEEELADLPRKILKRKWGFGGWLLGMIPLVRRQVIARLNRRPTPGRLYSFLAVKPA